MTEFQRLLMEGQTKKPMPNLEQLPKCCHDAFYASSNIRDFSLKEEFPELVPGTPEHTSRNTTGALRGLLAQQKGHVFSVL